MKTYLTFAEYLARRSAEEPSRPPGDPVAERSITGGLFKSVNPARPVSPMNSRLFALPGRRRFKSQIMGR
jgi:hypothetical protein